MRRSARNVCVLAAALALAASTAFAEIALAGNALAEDAPAEDAVAIKSGAELSQMVLHDPAAPVAGNPKGDVTIVAFLDYNCPYCRRSTPQLDAFLKSDPNVRLVYKDWPILAQSSMMEAKVAIAAGYQGKYQQAHHAMMAITLRPATTEAVKAAIAGAGIDVAQLNKDLAAHNDDINALIARNNAEAEALGFNGTPVFLVGPFTLAQALDEGGFRQAVSDARARRTSASRR